MLLSRPRLEKGQGAMKKNRTEPLICVLLLANPPLFFTARSTAEHERWTRLHCFSVMQGGKTEAEIEADKQARLARQKSLSCECGLFNQSTAPHASASRGPRSTMKSHDVHISHHSMPTRKSRGRTGRSGVGGTPVCTLRRFGPVFFISLWWCDS